MDIKPTRMGLLQTKKRLALADKGYDLLKQKYDALIMKFFEKIKRIKQLRKELAPIFSKGQEQLIISEAHHSVATIQASIKEMQPQDNIKITTTKTFGVKQPIFSREEKKTQETKVFQHQATTELQEIATHIKEQQEQIFELINEQIALVNIAKEISRTKKKVNSLEKRVIPKLNETKKKISFVLEERERELYTKQKKVKEKKEQTKKNEKK